MSRFRAVFWYNIVKFLPNKLIYFCFMYVMSYATTGKYRKTSALELTWMEAIQRFSSDKIRE